MFKKIVSVFILCILLGTSCFTATMAADTNLLLNGSFEEAKDGDWAASWQLMGDGKKGENTEISSSDAADGEKSLHFYGESSSVFVSQTIENIAPKTKYTFKAKLRLVTKGTGLPQVKVNYFSPDGYGSYNTVEEPSDAFDVRAGRRWHEVTFTSTAPEHCTRVSLLVRLVGGGECYWDDVQFIGRTATKEELDAAAKAATESHYSADAGPVAQPSASQATSYEILPDGSVNFIKNGSFEVVSPKGLPVDWALTGGKVGENIVVSTDKPKVGENAVRFFGTSTSIFISQLIYNLIPGETYKLSGYIKTVSGPGSSFVKFEFQDAENQHIGEAGCDFGKNWKDGEWSYIEDKVKIPEGTARASMLVRLVGGGEAFWDGLCLTGKSGGTMEQKAYYINEFTPDTADADIDLTAYKPPFGENTNLLVNAGFEEASESGAASWQSRTGWNSDSSCAFTETTNVYSGEKALKLVDTTGTNNPFVSQIVPVVGGAEYQISFRVRKESGVCTPLIKFEFWGDRSLPGASTVAETAVDAGKNAPDEWRQHNLTFKAPKNALDVTILVRILGQGTAYFDDVSFYMTAPPSAFDLETDWVFYYSDWESGSMTTHAQLAFFPELHDAMVDFAIYDGENVIFEEKNVRSVDGNATVNFNLSLLKEKQKKYIASASMHSTDGTVLETHTQEIYKYDRPKYLREDGIYMKNGTEPIAPVFTYHCSHYPEAAEAGVNIVQGNAFPTAEGHLRYLDEAQKHGLMVLIPLYYGMKPAGHLDNVERTIDVITEIKDHPALFGYAVMDEPFLSAEDPERDMHNSYRLIRDLDENHPVYTVEAVQGFYKTCAKYVDILAIDPYGVATNLNTSSSTVKAMEAVEYKKPVYTLLEAFRHPDGHYPTGDEERNMIYQALISGASAIGYYSFSDSETDADGKYTIPIFEVPDIWNSIKTYNEKEYAVTFDHFVFGKTPAFNEYRGSDFWYASWVSGQDLYVVVLGMKKDTPVHASVPLTSFDGSVQIDGFSAEVIAGADAATFSGSGTLETDLLGAQTILFKITSDTAADFTKLGKTRVDDLSAYPWARTQIARLDEKDIVNRTSTWSFNPAQPITRGDFAYFLIRTLGLTSDSTTLFADVDPNAHYAKEIATGQALGILKGVGDNRYNPEAAISRQDMMTIIARGMQLSGEADLTAFSDSAQIADYAVSSVKAMIASGLIKGNADGTVNPAGNTTRAEAAVIMARILDM
ncbi:MAG: S-layer homology domain-containing protein [Clostridia bacterium]|nr:S-layer homology domain-containing protein [Clostridia bacterium]